MVDMKVWSSLCHFGPYCIGEQSSEGSDEPVHL